ncbi:MAG: sigma 54-interacting transcriptional regulator [Deltaproteobacteria bacterium]|nr:sigma 54-interacting transcriptional regulator [Deltaproteobacteria bacterium]MBN2845826.1 sigma 54-interacting transcriptional regulator [Deltaproteobacteria bacterium]
MIKKYHDSEMELTAEDMCEAVINSTYFGIIAVDKKGYIIFANEAAKELLDYHDEVVPHTIKMADMAYDIWLGYKKIIETGKPQLNVPATYGGRTLVAQRTPIMCNDKLVGVMGVFQEMKAYEKLSKDLFEVREYAEEIKAIIESSYDGIYVTDGDANTIWVNSAYEKITGIQASQVMGRNMRDLVREGFYSESVSLKVLETRDSVTIRQNLKSGKEILVTGNPIYDEMGTIKMIVTNVRDMTDLVELNRRLETSLGLTSAYKEKLQELQRSATRGSDLIMVSESMLRIYDLVERVSKTDATVLLYGETGVGKDRIAEEIHDQSNRSESGIFVKINCGAIPETLLESELFGYEKGAFTGASKEGKTGLFEVANGGTLFLDEVESMSLVLQSKLLRVLQNFEITRVGGTVPKKVDVRLICASNQDLKILIEKKEFRADLYYRLNVVPIYIPPLRERRDDIPYLINLFVNQFNQKHGTDRILSREALSMLLQYSWPGNVREVSNVIERLIVVTPDNVVFPHHLPLELCDGSRYESVNSGLTLKEHLEKVELSLIQSAVKRHGSARKASPYLGVDSSTITRKLKKMNGRL